MDGLQEENKSVSGKKEVLSAVKTGGAPARLYSALFDYSGSRFSYIMLNSP